MTAAMRLSEMEAHVNREEFAWSSTTDTASLLQKVSDYVRGHPFTTSAAVGSLLAAGITAAYAVVAPVAAACCLFISLSAALASLIAVIRQKIRERFLQNILSDLREEGALSWKAYQAICSSSFQEERLCELATHLANKDEKRELILKWIADKDVDRALVFFAMKARGMVVDPDLYRGYEKPQVEGRFLEKMEGVLISLADGFGVVVDNVDISLERLQRLYQQFKSCLASEKAPRVRVIALQKAWQRVNDCYEKVWQRANSSKQALHLFCGCHLAPMGETLLPGWDNSVISGVDRGIIDTDAVAAPLTVGTKPTALLLTTRAGAGNAAISRVIARALSSRWHVQMAPSVTPFEEKAWNTLCEGGWWKLSTFFMKGYLARNADFEKQRQMRQGLVDAAVALYEPQALFLAAPNTVAAALKVATERRIPLVGVSADYHTEEYALLPEGAEVHLLVPDKEAGRAVQGRIKEDRIWPIGYPVQDPFYHFAALKRDPEEVLRLKASIGGYLGSELSLGSHEDAVTLMMGSLGCGDVIEKYVQQILKMRFDRPLHLFLCCGSNEGLCTRLQRYTNSEHVILHPLKRINPESVAALYAVSSALITKPGGATLAEAIVMRIPMLLDNTAGHLEAVVWERGNMRFAVDKGIGVEVTAFTDVEGLLRPLLEGGNSYKEIAMPAFTREFGPFMSKLYGVTA